VEGTCKRYLQIPNKLHGSGTGSTDVYCCYKDMQLETSFG